MAELKTFSRIPMRTWRWLGVNESRIPADINEHVKTQKILGEAGKEDEVVLTQREGGQYELQVHIEEGGTVEEVYEPFLIMEGFIKRTPRGRMATPLAYEHLGRNPYTSNIMQGDLFE